MKYLYAIVLQIILISAYSQSAPQKMNYQAVARNNSGGLIINQNIKIKSEILDANQSTVLYAETHSTTTNQYGLFTIQIGGGTVDAGSFSNINWGDGTKYNRISIDFTGGNNFQLMGTSQLLSVPYALHSANGIPLNGTQNQTLSWCDGSPVWGPCTATLTTTAVSNITGTSAVSGGNITSNRGNSVTERGVVWSTSSNPTISLTSKTSDGSGNGAFTSNLSNLIPNTTYYVRSYATNGSGTAYGNELNFSTPVLTSNCIQQSGLPNGGGGYINLGTLGAQNVFSVSMWIKPTAYQNPQSIVIDASHGSTLNWVIQSINSGSTWTWGNSEFSLTADTWQHLLLTYDNGNRKIFVNGNIVQSWTQAMTYSGSPSLYLGNWPEGNRRFSGSIDELYITRDIQQTSNFTPAQFISSTSANTFGYWRFEEGTGTNSTEQTTGSSFPLGIWTWTQRQ